MQVSSPPRLPARRWTGPQRLPPSLTASERGAGSFRGRLKPALSLAQRQPMGSNLFPRNQSSRTLLTERRARTPGALKAPQGLRVPPRRPFSFWERIVVVCFQFLGQRKRAKMPRYYFDIREDKDLTPDEEGADFDTIQEVQAEAAQSLADMAREAVSRPNTYGPHHRRAIEVRDDKGPVLKALFTFDLERQR